MTRQTTSQIGMCRLSHLPLVSTQAKQNKAANISAIATERARKSSALVASIEATSSTPGVPWAGVLFARLRLLPTIPLTFLEPF